jgi:ParB family chromosome partitioning protein
MLIEISKIEVGERLRSRLDPEKLRQLADDMECHGQLQEIIVAIKWGEGGRSKSIVEKATLIAGYRRLEAAKLLGWTSIRCTKKLSDKIDTDSDVDLLRVEFSENELHESFTEMERVAFGVKIKERIAAAALERKRTGKRLDYEYDPETGYKIWQKGCEETAIDLPSDSKEGISDQKQYNGGEVDDYVANIIGVGRTKFKQGEYVLKHGTEEQHAAIDCGEASIHGTYHDLKQKERSSKPQKTDPLMEKLKAEEAEAVSKRQEFDALPPDGKITELQRLLRDTNARAADAESRLARTIELWQNEKNHLEGKLENLSNQLEAAQARIKELEGGK